ncbi:hypothetical protein L208DRAFT_1382148 [Tricholoma matsutake]|nr:hypothetical protein L208DRAFT_1382148 [Tricholoma matsutake 945]
MTKRIEKRWKALDQPMFVLALVLNPFQGISHFGDKAAISPFTLNTILLETYHRVHSRPPKIPHTEDEQDKYESMKLQKEKEVSEAFLSYLSSKGVFEDWEKNKQSFQSVHGENPFMMWQAFLNTPSTSELADFATLLLSISVNQAGLEHSFSDLKIKKMQLQNRLKLLRLEKMAKVGANIRSSQKDAGLVKEHMKWQNHDQNRVAKLLKVPRYADLLEDDDGADANRDGEELSGPQLGLVRSCEGWQKEMAKWVEEEQQAYTEEAQLMELLADEEADEDRIPDDGESEKSGDDFDG